MSRLRQLGWLLKSEFVRIVDIAGSPPQLTDK
jgi:hypothetical protein